MWERVKVKWWVLMHWFELIVVVAIHDDFMLFLPLRLVDFKLHGEQVVLPVMAFYLVYINTPTLF